MRCEVPSTSVRLKYNTLGFDLEMTMTLLLTPKRLLDHAFNLWTQAAGRRTHHGQH